MKKIIKIIIWIIISIILTIPCSALYMKMTHVYKYEYKENQKLCIDIDEQSNKKSYARDMRLVSVRVNNKLIDLGQYDNDEWVWHPEWGYVLYQQGNSHFEILIQEDIRSLEIEYVKEASSGTATFSLNNNIIAKIDMYRKSWKTTTVKSSYLTAKEIVVIQGQIFALMLLVCGGINYLISCYQHKNDEINQIPMTLGMFDMAKGLGMIGIIAGHTLEAVSNDGLGNILSNQIIIGVIGGLFLYGLNPMFFMASGFGFRVGERWKTVKKQINFWIKPYLIVSIGVFIVSSARTLIFRNMNFDEMKSVLLPLLYGNAHEGNVFGKYVYSIGPMWFGTTLCFSWILLNFVLNMNSKLGRLLASGIIIGGGYYLSNHDFNFWCIPQILFVYVMLYLGYILCKKKMFVHQTKKSIVIYGIGLMVGVGLMIINGPQYNVASSMWGENYLMAICASALLGIGVLWLLLRMNPLFKGKVGFVNNIGRGSYFIFYIHSFEWLVIPWNKIAKLLHINYYFKFIFIFVMRLILIYLIYKLVMYIIQKKKAHYRIRG